MTRQVYVHPDTDPEHGRECRPGVWNAGNARTPDFMGGFFYHQAGDPPGTRRFCGATHPRAGGGTWREEPGELCHWCGWPVDQNTTGQWTAEGRTSCPANLASYVHEIRPAGLAST